MPFYLVCCCPQGIFDQLPAHERALKIGKVLGWPGFCFNRRARKKRLGSFTV
jgi:hypothetical protein